MIGYTLPELVKNEKHSLKRGPFGGSLKKECFVKSGYKVYEQKNAIYKRFDIGDYYINKKKFEELKAFKVLPNDLIISCSGTIGKIAVVPEDAKEGIINQALLKLRLDNSIVTNKYFIYLFKSPSIQNQLFGVSHGSGIKNFPPMATLKKIIFPLPPLATQKKIAAILDEADTLRQLNKQLIIKYDALTQSLFLDMFGDPVTNPMGWEVFSLQDVLEIRNGKNQKKVLNKNGKYPIYGSGGIMDYADDYISDENSVIIGRKGNINKPILVKEKYWHVDTAFGLNPKKEILDYNYLFFFCKRYNFEQHNKTVTIPSLTKATLLNIKIPIPSINLQNQFAERVAVIEQQKAQAQQSLQKSEDLFNSLLQKAFKGELVK